MAQPKGTHFVITAAETDSGAPVYLRADGSWTRTLAEAHAIDNQQDDQQKDQLLEQALRQERAVCDPYCFPVVLDGGRPAALSVREKIRATGPSTPLRRPD